MSIKHIRRDRLYNLFILNTDKMLLIFLKLRTFQPLNFHENISLQYCIRNTALFLYCVTVKVDQAKFGIILPLRVLTRIQLCTMVNYSIHLTNIYFEHSSSIGDVTKRKHVNYLDLSDYISGRLKLCVF